MRYLLAAFLLFAGLACGADDARRRHDFSQAVPEVADALEAPDDELTGSYRAFLRAAYLLRLEQAGQERGGEEQHSQIPSLLADALRGCPDNRLVLSLLWDWHNRHDSVGELEKLISELEPLHPEAGNLRLFRGMVLTALERTDEAIALLESFKPTDIGQSRGRVAALFDCHVKRGEFDQVYKLVGEAMADPELANDGLVRQMQLRCHLHRNEKADARALAWKLVRDDAFYATLQDPRGAINDFSNINDPQLMQAFCLRLMKSREVSYDEGLWQQVNAVLCVCSLILEDGPVLSGQLRDMMEIPDAALRLELVRRLFDRIDRYCRVKMGEGRLSAVLVDIAMSYCDELLKIAPVGDLSVVRNAIRYCIVGHRVEQAAALLQRLPQRTPVEEFQLAGALSQLKRHDEALAIFARLEPLVAGGETGLDSANFYIAYGMAAADGREWRRAIDALKRAHELSPSSAEIANALGYIMADQGEDLQAAEALVMQANAAEPESAAIWDSVAWVKFRRGQPPQALEAMAEAMLKMTTDPQSLGDDYEICGHLGEILESMGYSQLAQVFRLNP